MVSNLNQREWVITEDFLEEKAHDPSFENFLVPGYATWRGRAYCRHQKQDINVATVLLTIDFIWPSPVFPLRYVFCSKVQSMILCCIQLIYLIVCSNLGPFLGFSLSLMMVTFLMGNNQEFCKTSFYLCLMFSHCRLRLWIWGRIS